MTNEYINETILFATIIFQRSLVKQFLITKKIGFNINVLSQTACLVVNQIMVDSFALLFNCTLADQILESMTVLKVKREKNWSFLKFRIENGNNRKSLKSQFL